MESLISVIIPVYNAEKYITETLNSILAQSYQTIEVLLINDGSTDKSEELILSFQDSRIKYFKIKNGGMCKALNYGIANSKGDYYKFFDADDIMEKDHLFIQYNSIKNQNNCIATSEWARFYNGDLNGAKFIPESVWESLKPIEWIKRALKQNSDMMPGWLFLIPKSLIKIIGGWNESLTLNNDFEFGVRLILNSEMVIFAKGAKVYYRSGNLNTLSNSNSYKSYESAFRVTKMGCDYILKYESSAEMRLLCANRYQEWIYRIYPKFPELINKFQNEIDILGGSNLKISSGPIFRIINLFIGWRLTKILQLKVNEIKHKYFESSR